MQVVSAHAGVLRFSAHHPLEEKAERHLSTGLSALDGLAPRDGFELGTIHEVMGVTGTMPYLLPLLLARSASARGLILWDDHQLDLYPPAVAAYGVPLDRLVALRVRSHEEKVWAAAECLRCRGVAACIVVPSRLSRVEVRRLQLAAEQGGGVGILLRSTSAASAPYAAATRWVVRPAPGERMIQRWTLELIHGHGGRIGQSVLLEACRETHHVRAVNSVAHRPAQTPPIAASA